MKILNGRLGEDKTIGAYTCFNKNGGKSTTDYVVASYVLFPLVKNIEIGFQDQCLSDVHCTLHVKFSGQPTTISVTSSDANDNDSSIDSDHSNRSSLPKHVFKWN